MRVAVLGGGITGLFVSKFLAEEGAEVTLYEPQDLGHFSVHAAGLIEPYRFDRMNTTGMIVKMLKYMRRGVTSLRRLDGRWVLELLKTLNRDPPEEAWSTIREMAKFSLRYYREMAEVRNDFDYRDDGLLEVYRSREELERGEEEEKRSPFKARFEVVDLEGFAGAVFFPDLSRLATEKFVARISRELEERKVRVRREEGKVQGNKVNGEEYDVVVLSNGVWMRRELTLPLTAFKGYGAWVRGESKFKNAMVLAEEGVAISPLSDHVKVTAGFSADFSTQGSMDLLGKVADVVKAEEVLRYSQGFRPCSPDGFPIIGRRGDWVVVTGACRLGWSYGPAMGRWGADLVLGKVRSLGYLSRYVEENPT